MFILADNLGCVYTCVCVWGARGGASKFDSLYSLIMFNHSFLFLLDRSCKCSRLTIFNYSFFFFFIELQSLDINYLDQVHDKFPKRSGNTHRKRKNRRSHQLQIFRSNGLFKRHHKRRSHLCDSSWMELFRKKIEKFSKTIKCRFP